MLCLCYVIFMLCSVSIGDGILCCVILCYFRLNSGMLCCDILSHVILGCAILYNTIFMLC